MSDFNFRCSLPDPYPVVRHADLNNYDFNMLLTLFSEKFSMISEYIMNSIILGDKARELADVFECIAMSEIKHFKLIGKVLATGNGVFSSARLTSLLRSSKVSRGSRGQKASAPVDIISQSFDLEKNSVSNIKLINSQIHNNEIKALLSRIMADEEHHAEILTHLKRRYS